MTIHRRGFIKRTAFTAAGLMLGKQAAFSNVKNERFAPTGGAGANPSYDLMKEVMKYRKVDAYGNAYAPDSAASKAQIDFADRLGVEKLFIASPIAVKMGKTPDEIRAYNDHVLTAVKQHPDRLIGQFTIHPAYPKEALEEMKRCIDLGMVGMKLYNQVKINDPLFYPILEKYIDYNMIIHVHGESQLGVGGYRMKYDVKNTPTISVPEEFVEVATRYPEAMFQYAHIGGGGDWEYACKVFRNHENIYVDTGGSNNEEGMVDFAVETLGEDRVFFGCDASYFQGVAKILASALTEKQKKKVFFDNYNAILKRSGRNF